LWFGDRHGAAQQAAADHHEHGPTPDWWRLALVGLFFALYVGLEIGFAGWIATYSDELGLGSGWATGLTAAFWAGFLGGRLAMVWRGDDIDTGDVLRWSIGGATVLAVAVVIVGAHAIPLLIVSTLFGFVIAPQFPTMLAHLHRVVPLTGPVTAWCIAGSAVGGLILPPTIGALMDSVAPVAMPWTVAIASAASAVVVLAIDRWALVLPGVNGAPRAPISDAGAGAG
jgi:FHS family glucose/mannose:H+ symporter-like MFS transporter